MSALAPRKVEAPARVWCPHCACLEAPGCLTLEDGQVLASCARCERTFSLGHTRGLLVPTLTLVSLEPLPVEAPPAPAALSAKPAVRADGDEAFLVPETQCPKCIAPRDGGVACPRCGLVFAQADHASLAPPTWLAERWMNVWNDWNNPARHRSMLERALQLDALPALARLYRLRLTWAPGDLIAEEASAELMRRASLPLLATQRPDLKRQRTQRLLIGLLCLFSALIAVGVWAVR